MSDALLRQPDPEPDPQPDPFADPPTVEVQREERRAEVPVTVQLDPEAEVDPGAVPEGLVPAEHSGPAGPEVTQELRRVGRLRRSRHRIALSLEHLTGRRRKPRADGRARHRAAPHRGQLVLRGVLITSVLAMAVGGVLPSTETGPSYPVPPATPIVPAPPLPTTIPTTQPSIKPTVTAKPTPAPVRPTAPSTTKPPSSTTKPPPPPTTAPPPPTNTPATCVIINQGPDVEPNVRQVACFLDRRFPDIVRVLGRAPRALATSDHPRGLAADLVVNTQRALGDQIADCAARHFNDWGLAYVIWRQRIKLSAVTGFTLMEDRGSITANHFDHVHLSFKRGVTPRNLTC